MKTAIAYQFTNEYFHLYTKRTLFIIGDRADDSNEMEFCATMILELTLGVLGFVILYYIFNTKENLKNLPPGPKGRLWWGVEVDIHNLHLNFTTWWKEFGDIFEVKVFGRRILVLNTPDKIREAFDSKKYTEVLNHRPPNFIGSKIYDNYKCVLLRKYDPEFKEMKKAMIEAMNEHGFRSKNYRCVVAGILKDVTEQFVKLDGTPCDPMDILRPSFCKMIGTLFTGNCSCFLEKNIDEFDCYGDTMIQSQIHAIYTRFPWIRWIPFCFYRSLYNAVEHYKQNLKRSLILDLRASYDENQIKCMVHHLFGLQDRQKLDHGKPWLTDDHIHGITMDLINTSVLTSKSVMSGFIFLWLHFPEVQQKIQQEIDKVIGRDRVPEVEDRKEMPYLQACIYESLRYQSHLPLTAAHNNSEKIDIFGYTIPPRTIIYGNLFACHHDEELWGDPWEYRPERYLTDDGHLIDKNHPNMKNLIAFGVGVRLCVGYEMALDRMFLITSYLLQKFSFVVPNGSLLKSHDPREMILASPVLLPPPYKCRVVKRMDKTNVD